jgi:zinc ribbon domain-containing protein
VLLTPIPLFIYNNMAKKEVADLSVEEKLKTLYQLQTTLSGIDEKKALRGELPLEVQDLEDELEGLNIRVDKIKHDIADAEAAIQGNQQLIQEAQKSVERYQHQLDEVKNNREYDTLTKEIEYQSLEIELANKKIREAAMAIEERQRDLEIAQKTISERQIDLDEKRDELDEIMQETREEEEKLKAHAKELELKIEPRLLTSFKRIRKNARNGLGIVYVQRDACGGCFNKIPPQRQLDIRMHKKIIVCEYCGRILVDPELAGVTVNNAATEVKPKRAKRTTRKKKEVDTEE